MRDSQVPSLGYEEEEEGQATLMWDRDEVDLSDLDFGREPDPSRVKPGGPATGGLDEGELFGDLSDLAGEQRAASMPVEGRLVQTTRPPPANANDAPLMAPKRPKGRVWPGRYWAWAVAAAALAAALASAAYVLSGR